MSKLRIPNITSVGYKFTISHKTIGEVNIMYEDEALEFAKNLKKSYPFHHIETEKMITGFWKITIR